MPENLFTEINLGPYTLANRIFMAPMTRNRAPANVANELMAGYYAQRASSGLIITEGSQISPQAVGYPATPGIYNEAQVDGWRIVTHAVHDKGGHIFLQLWHTGRVSHPDYHGGDLPVAPSAIAPRGEAPTYEGMKPYVRPRALLTEEIAGIVEDYAAASEMALAAGFDGVEIHGANGYLLDQFLRDGTNKRNDRYGGSLENRTRLLTEVTAAVADVCGHDRVGVRLSPSGTFNDMSDSEPVVTFTTMAEKLNEFDLAYLHIVDVMADDIRHGAKSVPLISMREAYNGRLVVCGEYDLERARIVVSEGHADAVAFGRLYIANPDLVERFKRGAPLNEPDLATFYGGGEVGYTDYPALEGG
ncbi:MAG: alkene reductase [Thermodesulfobacteriota bacterium]